MLRQAFFALLCVVSVIAKCSLADEDQALMRALQVVNSTTARAQSGLNLLHELVGYRSDVVTQHRRVLSVCQTSWESSRADYEAMQAQVADLKRQPDAKVSLPDSPAGLLGRFNAYTDHLSVIQSKARALAADSAEMDAAATAWLVALSRDARQALALKEDATAELNLLTIRGEPTSSQFLDVTADSVQRTMYGRAALGSAVGQLVTHSAPAVDSFLQMSDPRDVALKPTLTLKTVWDAMSRTGNLVCHLNAQREQIDQQLRTIRELGCSGAPTAVGSMLNSPVSEQVTTMVQYIATLQAELDEAVQRQSEFDAADKLLLTQLKSCKSAWHSQDGALLTLKVELFQLKASGDSETPDTQVAAPAEEQELKIAAEREKLSRSMFKLEVNEKSDKLKAQLKERVTSIHDLFRTTSRSMCELFQLTNAVVLPAGSVNVPCITSAKQCSSILPTPSPIIPDVIIIPKIHPLCAIDNGGCDKEHATCVVDESVAPPLIKCVCDAGFKSINSGKKCVKADCCATTQCPVGQVCESTNNGLVCSCKCEPGYTTSQDDAQLCVAIDPCAGCYSDGTCPCDLDSTDCKPVTPNWSESREKATHTCECKHWFWAQHGDKSCKPKQWCGGLPCDKDEICSEVSEYPKRVKSLGGTEPTGDDLLQYRTCTPKPCHSKACDPSATCEIDEGSTLGYNCVCDETCFTAQNPESTGNQKKCTKRALLKTCPKSDDNQYCTKFGFGETNLQFTTCVEGTQEPDINNKCKFTIKCECKDGYKQYGSSDHCVKEHACCLDEHGNNIEGCEPKCVGEYGQCVELSDGKDFECRCKGTDRIPGSLYLTSNQKIVPSPRGACMNNECTALQCTAANACSAPWNTNPQRDRATCDEHATCEPKEQSECTGQDISDCVVCSCKTGYKGNGQVCVPEPCHEKHDPCRDAVGGEQRFMTCSAQTSEAPLSGFECSPQTRAGAKPGDTAWCMCNDQGKKKDTSSDCTNEGGCAWVKTDATQALCLPATATCQCVDACYRKVSGSTSFSEKCELIPDPCESSPCGSVDVERGTQGDLKRLQKVCTRTLGLTCPPTPKCSCPGQLVEKDGKCAFKHPCDSRPCEGKENTICKAGEFPNDHNILRPFTCECKNDHFEKEDGPNAGCKKIDYCEKYSCGVTATSMCVEQCDGDNPNSPLCKKSGECRRTCACPACSGFQMSKPVSAKDCFKKIRDVAKPGSSDWCMFEKDGSLTTGKDGTLTKENQCVFVRNGEDDNRACVSILPVSKPILPEKRTEAETEAHSCIEEIRAAASLAHGPGGEADGIWCLFNRYGDQIASRDQCESKGGGRSDSCKWTSAVKDSNEAGVCLARNQAKIDAQPMPAKCAAPLCVEIDYCTAKPNEQTAVWQPCDPCSTNCKGRALGRTCECKEYWEPQGEGGDEQGTDDTCKAEQVSTSCTWKGRCAVDNGGCGEASKFICNHPKPDQTNAGTCSKKTERTCKCNAANGFEKVPGSEPDGEGKVACIHTDKLRKCSRDNGGCHPLARCSETTQDPFVQCTCKSHHTGDGLIAGCNAVNYCKASNKKYNPCELKERCISKVECGEGESDECTAFVTCSCDQSGKASTSWLAQLAATAAVPWKERKLKALAEEDYYQVTLIEAHGPVSISAVGSERGGKKDCADYSPCTDSSGWANGGCLNTELCHGKECKCATHFERTNTKTKVAAQTLAPSVQAALKCLKADPQGCPSGCLSPPQDDASDEDETSDSPSPRPTDSCFPLGTERPPECSLIDYCLVNNGNCGPTDTSECKPFTNVNEKDNFGKVKCKCKPNLHRPHDHISSQEWSAEWMTPDQMSAKYKKEKMHCVPVPSQWPCSENICSSKDNKECQPDCKACPASQPECTGHDDHVLTVGGNAVAKRIPFRASACCACIEGFAGKIVTRIDGTSDGTSFVCEPIDPCDRTECELPKTPQASSDGKSCACECKNVPGAIDGADCVSHHPCTPEGARKLGIKQCSALHSSEHAEAAPLCQELVKPVSPSLLRQRKCVCKPGYTPDECGPRTSREDCEGFQCVLVDPCETHNKGWASNDSPCPEHSYCKANGDADDGFVCKCGNREGQQKCYMKNENARKETCVKKDVCETQCSSVGNPLKQFNFKKCMDSNEDRETIGMTTFCEPLTCQADGFSLVPAAMSGRESKCCVEVNPCDDKEKCSELGQVCKKTGPGTHECACDEPCFFPGDQGHCQPVDFCASKLQNGQRFGCDTNAECNPCYEMAAPQTGGDKKCVARGCEAAQLKHKRTCSCKTGFDGGGYPKDPSMNVEDQSCASVCAVECGAHASCSVTQDGKPVCSCESGFSNKKLGNIKSWPFSKDDDKDSKCECINSCTKDKTCKTFYDQAKTCCKECECKNHCPDGRKCKNGETCCEPSECVCFQPNTESRGGDLTKCYPTCFPGDLCGNELTTQCATVQTTEGQVSAARSQCSCKRNLVNENVVQGNSWRYGAQPKAVCTCPKPNICDSATRKSCVNHEDGECCPAAQCQCMDAFKCDAGKFMQCTDIAPVVRMCFKELRKAAITKIDADKGADWCLFNHNGDMIDNQEACMNEGGGRALSCAWATTSKGNKGACASTNQPKAFNKPAACATNIRNLEATKTDKDDVWCLFNKDGDKIAQKDRCESKEGGRLENCAWAEVPGKPKFGVCLSSKAKGVLDKGCCDQSKCHCVAEKMCLKAENRVCGQDDDSECCDNSECKCQPGYEENRQGECHPVCAASTETNKGVNCGAHASCNKKTSMEHGSSICECASGYKVKGAKTWFPFTTFGENKCVCPHKSCDPHKFCEQSTTVGPKTTCCPAHDCKCEFKPCPAGKYCKDGSDCCAPTNCECEKGTEKRPWLLRGNAPNSGMVALETMNVDGMFETFGASSTFGSSAITSGSSDDGEKCHRICDDTATLCGPHTECEASDEKSTCNCQDGYKNVAAQQKKTWYPAHTTEQDCQCAHTCTEFEQCPVGSKDNNCCEPKTCVCKKAHVCNAQEHKQCSVSGNGDKASCCASDKCQCEKEWQCLASDNRKCNDGAECCKPDQCVCAKDFELRATTPPWKKTSSDKDGHPDGPCSKMCDKSVVCGDHATCDDKVGKTSTCKCDSGFINTKLGKVQWEYNRSPQCCSCKFSCSKGSRCNQLSGCCTEQSECECEPGHEARGGFSCKLPCLDVGLCGALTQCASVSKVNDPSYSQCSCVPNAKSKKAANNGWRYSAETAASFECKCDTGFKATTDNTCEKEHCHKDLNVNCGEAAECDKKESETAHAKAIKSGDTPPFAVCKCTGDDFFAGPELTDQIFTLKSKSLGPGCQKRYCDGVKCGSGARCDEPESAKIKSAICLCETALKVHTLRGKMSFAPADASGGLCCADQTQEPNGDYKYDSVAKVCVKPVCIHPTITCGANAKCLEADSGPNNFHCQCHANFYHGSKKAWTRKTPCFALSKLQKQAGDEPCNDGEQAGCAPHFCETADCGSEADCDEDQSKLAGRAICKCKGETFNPLSDLSDAEQLKLKSSDAEKFNPCQGVAKTDRHLAGKGGSEKDTCDSWAFFSLQKCWGKKCIPNICKNSRCGSNSQCKETESRALAGNAKNPSSSPLQHCSCDEGKNHAGKPSFKVQPKTKGEGCAGFCKVKSYADAVTGSGQCGLGAKCHEVQSTKHNTVICECASAQEEPANPLSRTDQAVALYFNPQQSSLSKHCVPKLCSVHCGPNARCSVPKSEQKCREQADREYCENVCVCDKGTHPNTDIRGTWILQETEFSLARTAKTAGRGCKFPHDMCKCTGNGNEMFCSLTGQRHCASNEECYGKHEVKWGMWESICKKKVEQKAIPVRQEEDPCCPKGDERNKKNGKNAFCYWGTSNKGNRRGCPIRFDGPWPCSKCPKCEWKTKKGQCFLVGQGPEGPISTPAK